MIERVCKTGLQVLAMVLAMVLALVVGPAVAAGLGHSLSPVDPPVVAPEFTLPDMDGEPHSLADYRGQVVLLNFWATWCPPCREEMPSMERLYQALEDDGFAVVAVNQFETPDHVFAYTGQLEVDPTFPLLFDSDSSVANSFRVVGLPSTYVIDKQGRVRYRAIGGREFDHPDVEALIRDLMNEPAGTAATGG
ncbi:MAG: TlpA disulfide reductase family protein [Gammaproteobacteria bacterium]|nr:TlpA disulfide reductase family protein [Gammaproteobacteria bacterium]